MTTLAAVVMVSVLHADPTAFLVLSRQGLSNDELKTSLITIEAALLRSEVAVWSPEETSKKVKAVGGDVSSCGRRLACLAALGAKLNATRLVALSVTKVGEDRAWILEAIEVKQASLLASEKWIDAANQDVSEPAEQFARQLGRPPPPADAPVAAKVEPQVAPTPAVTLRSPRERPRVLPRGLLLGSAVAAAVALGLGAAAAVTSGRVSATVAGPDPSGPRLSALTLSEAEALASTSNTLAVGGLIAAVLAAGLGVGAFLTW